MRNIFLDLGTHYGQGLREFIQKFKMNENWTIHTFEANPITYDIFMNDYLHLTPNVIPHNEAIGCYDGFISLNIESPPNEGDTGQGSSVISLDRWDPWGLNTVKKQFNVQREVSCIDFSCFIKNNFDISDNIVVKMDIEGSEYSVLEKMIQDNTMSYINYICVEWHSHFFIDKNEMMEKERLLIDKIREYKLTLENWK